jgi:hypothetical protein
VRPRPGHSAATSGGMGSSARTVKPPLVRGSARSDLPRAVTRPRMPIRPTPGTGTSSTGSAAPTAPAGSGGGEQDGSSPEAGSALAAFGRPLRPRRPACASPTKTSALSPMRTG